MKTMPPRRSAGFSLIEILVSLVVLLIGLLGFASLLVQANKAEMESYQRVQALILMQDIVDRINTNRKAASCYVTPNPGGGSAYVGTGYSSTPVCTAGSVEQQARAVADLTEWNNLLQGAAETKGGNSVGAMVGARGCVAFDGASSQYTVTVVWQGLSDTTAPADGLTCGSGLYGNEAKRRAVSTVLSIANLS
mgnify:CR=1 FL=1